MTQPSPLHPELQKFARFMPRFSFSKQNLWLVRLLTRLSVSGAKPGDVGVENVYIPGPGGKIRVRMYRPKAAAAPGPALVWLHGGGYVMGIPEMADGACIQFARELGMPVFSVDYRCAPEQPFPAGLEDAYAVLKWAAGQAEVDPSRVAVGGESAGGGLAAALAQLALDRGGVIPACQVLIYPMLDDRTCLRGEVPHPELLTWNLASNRFGWEAYLGRPYGREDSPVYAIPARREDLSGLPPAWIGVGTLDLFCEEDIAYAERLRGCGVECELVVVPGAFHGFDTLASQTRVAQEFRKSQIAVLRRCLFPEP